MKCKGCGKEAKTPKGWCSRKCYAKNQHLVENSGRRKPVSNIEFKCKKCESITEGKPYRYKKQQFCSNKCSREYRSEQETIIDSCLNCGVEIKRNYYQVKNGIHKFCSKKCYREYDNGGKLRKTGRKTEWLSKECIICGNVFEVPPCRKETAKFCSRRCSSIAGSKAQGDFTKRTKIEKKIRKYLLDLGIVFIEQKPFSNITIPDFFIEPNIVVYADGDYWHNITDVMERDRRNNEYLKKNGYEVFRFWENEIHNAENRIKMELGELCLNY